jgi:SAM-dependent methyltransferase
MKSQDSTSYHEILPFLQELEPAGRVLVLGCGTGGDLGYLAKAGQVGLGVESNTALAESTRALNPAFEILEKNYLFLTLKENEYSGAWVNRTFNAFPPEQVQRMVATIFKGLKTGGVLGVIAEEGEGSYEDRGAELTSAPRIVYLYREMQLCSMFDQTGFQILKVGRQPEDLLRHQPARLLVLAKRI